MRKDVPQRIRLFRRLANLSQRDIAAALGRSQGWMSLVECGYRELTPQELTALASALGLPPSLLEAADEKDAS